MKLDRKYEIAVSAINSISRHDDEDQASVVAILDAVAEHVKAERAAHIERKNAKRDALLKGKG